MTDKETYVGPDLYAEKVDEDTFIAGPRAKAYDEGEEVSEGYYKSVRASINYRNRVMGLVANESEDTPDNYQDAQQVVSEFNDLDKELQKAQDQDDEQRIEEIEQEINNLQADLGSP